MRAKLYRYNWEVIPTKSIFSGSRTACQDELKNGRMSDKGIAVFILSALVAGEGFGSCMKIQGRWSLICFTSGASDVCVWFMQARIPAKQNGGRISFVRFGIFIAGGRNCLPESTPGELSKNSSGSRNSFMSIPSAQNQSAEAGLSLGQGARIKTLG
jgi:hypothetical protein